MAALVPPEKSFVPKYEAAAKKSAGTEGAAPLLVSIAQMTYRKDVDAAKSALDRLVRNHTGSPALKGLAFTLMYGAHYMTESYVLDVMGKMIEQSPPWRSFWCGDEGTGGPIPKAWNVQGWPTIYVLDAVGKIRAKGTRGKAMDTIVDELLAEMNQGPITPGE
jgi:hypothetical protein